MAKKIIDLIQNDEDFQSKAYLNEGLNQLRKELERRKQEAEEKARIEAEKKKEHEREKAAMAEQQRLMTQQLENMRREIER